MAILGNDIINALDKAEASTGEFEPLPEGEYILRCESSELKDTKSGNGQYIKTTFVVLAPKYQGRKIFINYNIRNSSAEAEKIGLSELKSLLMAGGRGRLTNTDELIGITFKGKVGIRKSKDPRFSDDNKITKYESADAANVKKAPAPVPAPEPRDSFSDAFAPTGTDDGEGDWFK